MNENYEIVIGLEVHAQLQTNTKLFSGDSTRFGAAPNTHVSPVSLAHPGTLPVLNEEVVALAVRLGLALNCDINPHNYFARKNYFYPDLPKGYQVSQHTEPVCKNGAVVIQTSAGEKSVRLNRIHIEEDAGKSLHDIFDDYSGIDLNRAGTPLLEIVSEPDLSSAEEAYLYLTELRRLVRWLDVCDGNMEEGSLRCDANISVRPKGDPILGTRVEIKNLNSIRNVKRAIESEAKRLIEITEAGGIVRQETRSFDADSNTSFSLRSKEEAEDYRYFPEPDLPPIHISSGYIEKIRSAMPPLPAALEKKYSSTFGLGAYDSAMICTEKRDCALFEQIVEEGISPKSAANWVTGPLRNYRNEQGITTKEFPLSAKQISSLIVLADEGKVHFNIASGTLLHAFIQNTAANPEDLAAQLNLLQNSDSDDLERWINEVIAAMPDKVKEYKSGKKGIIGLFAGRIKKQSGGKADMQAVTKLLEEKLSA